MFVLHERLEADTIEVCDWPFSKVLLMNDATYPWLILVPRRDALRDFHDLAPEDRPAMMDEIDRASVALEDVFAPDKMNVAALGNMVPQLHVHVIARFTSDQAWPGPVWGVVEAKPYGEAALEKAPDALRQSFA